MNSLAHDLTVLLPELILALGGMALLMLYAAVNLRREYGTMALGVGAVFAAFIAASAISAVSSMIMVAFPAPTPYAGFPEP